MLGFGLRIANSYFSLSCSKNAVSEHFSRNVDSRERQDQHNLKIMANFLNFKILEILGELKNFSTIKLIYLCIFLQKP